MLEPACHRCLTVVGLVCLCASSWGAEPTALSDTVRLSAASVTERRTVQVSGWMQQVDTLDFRRQGLTSVADALGRLPGVTVRDYGGAGGLKTVAVRGFSASHTLVAYDGIPLGDTRGGQVDVGRFALADLQSLRLSTAPRPLFRSRRAKPLPPRRSICKPTTHSPPTYGLTCRPGWLRARSDTSSPPLHTLSAFRHASG